MKGGKTNMTKERDNLIKAIEAYTKKHKGDVLFIASFCAFKGDDSEVIDELIVGYGGKEIVNIALEDLQQHLKNEKEDFVNW